MMVDAGDKRLWGSDPTSVLSATVARSIVRSVRGRWGFYAAFDGGKEEVQVLDLVVLRGA